MNMLNNKQFMISFCMTLVVVCVMFASSEIIHNTEVIFPEISALCIGYLLYHKHAWTVNHKRMLTCISTCAILGVIIVEYVPLLLWQQLCLAFIIGQLLLAYSGTDLAPMVSAIVLPVLLQSRGYIYPLSTIILTILVILFNEIEVKKQLRTKEVFKALNKPNKKEYLLITLRVMIVVVVTYMACAVDLKFIIAPPLIVAFIEFSKKSGKLREKPLKPIILLTISAIIGCLCRYIFTITYNIPITVTSIVAITITILLIYRTETYLPPIGAICLLALIVPEDILILFPLEIFIGTTIFMTFTKIIYRTETFKEYYHQK